MMLRFFLLYVTVHFTERFFKTLSTTFIRTLGVVQSNYRTVARYLATF